MFNENSAQQEVAAGRSEIREVQNPVISVMQQSNTEEITEPSETAGPTNLAWWDDMKYFWKRSANGGFHLAPQDSYVDDVLTEADFEINRAAKEFGNEKSEDLANAKAEAKAALEIYQTRTGFDPSGTEALSLLRDYRRRIILARKIVGATAVSANHRLQHTAASGGDLEAVKDTDFYKSDLENCERWAFKACYYEYIAHTISAEIDDNEVLRDLPEQIAKGVARLVYDDAIQRGNTLKRPAPAKQPSGGMLSVEELRQMRA